MTNLPLEQQTGGTACACSAPSPTYTPRFASLSDEDLNVLEMVYWLIVTQQAQPQGGVNYNTVQELFAPCRCWMCLSPRQRRELTIAHMLDLTACWDANYVRQVIRIIEAKSTPAQRSAGLDCARYNGITTVNCRNVTPI